jgi:dihydroorotase
MPGVETMVPLMLAQAAGKKVNIGRLTDLLSANPADRFSMEKKGSIREGLDADMMVINLKESRRIRIEDLHYRCGWTPYEGMNGIFPSRVYSRGDLIIEDENLCVKPGRGRNIRL